MLGHQGKQAESAGGNGAELGCVRARRATGTGGEAVLGRLVTLGKGPFYFSLSFMSRLFPFFLRNWNLTNGICYFFRM
jgi:hypothetical protein